MTCRRFSKAAFAACFALFSGLVARAQSPPSQNAETECLEALQTGGCQLRWEFEVTGAMGKSTQNNSAATPSILAILDFQWRAPRDPKIRKHDPSARRTILDRLVTHLVLKSGFTQVVAAGPVQPVPNVQATPSAQPVACSTACTAPVAQPAFEIEAVGTLGWTIGRNGQGGVFSEVGFGARGAFQDLLPSNQVYQSGGLTYIDLSSNNPQTVVGLYEATAHFNLAQWNHNQPASSSGKYHNVSNLLSLEVGYQNNSGLQQLNAPGPQTGTRNRFVGRFYINPELPSAGHTKITIGMEYSGGIDGRGPKIVQLFFGTNLNPAKLFGGTNTN
jgi:hypothetical protein